MVKGKTTSSTNRYHASYLKSRKSGGSILHTNQICESLLQDASPIRHLYEHPKVVCVAPSKQLNNYSPIFLSRNFDHHER
jgi:hypothetical protein